VPETCGTIADGAHHVGCLNGQDAYTGRILPVSFYSTLGSNGGGHAIDVGVTPKIGGNGAPPSAVARTELMERTVTIADMRGNESHGCSPPLSAKDTANDFMPIIATQEFMTFDLKNVTSTHNRSKVEYGQPSSTLCENPPYLVSNDVYFSVNSTAYGINSDAIDRSGEHKTGTAAERSGLGITRDVQPTIKARPTTSVAIATEVRRLTPRECERLQGFPDDYTLIPYRGKPAADGNRYKALGNSMAVNVMRWLGDRIAEVDRKVRE
jgi:site-specific DNA-cytosine methylase